MCVAFNFAPKGWAMCNGNLLPINQNQPLFALLGTTYGGDGRVNFALPNMRGCTPIGAGQSHTLGEKGGQPSHTIIAQETPAHTHFLQASSGNPNNSRPGGAFFATTTGNNVVYTQNPTNATTLNPASVTNFGGNQPHENRQPYLVLTWIIALTGIFPSQN